MSTILLVEDDPPIAASVRDLLEREGYAVRVATTLVDARRILSEDVTLAAMLLDWRLPDGEGIDLLKELRKTSDLPVIMVTARVELIDRVLGLEIGADDYVTKPFEPRELLARLKARLRTRQHAAPPPLQSDRSIEHAGVRIDLEAHEVTFQGRVVPLGRVEFDLLALLLTHPGRVFSRQELLHRVWGYERPPTTRTVDTHVVFLRTKLGADLIESVRSVGYRLRRES